jgi:hypothetical protein
MSILMESFEVTATHSETPAAKWSLAIRHTCCLYGKKPEPRGSRPLLDELTFSVTIDEPYMQTFDAWQKVVRGEANARLVFEQSRGRLTIEIKRDSVTGDRMLLFTSNNGETFAVLHANSWRALAQELASLGERYFDQENPPVIERPAPLVYERVGSNESEVGVSESTRAATSDRAVYSCIGSDESEVGVYVSESKR